jgi:RimJ/RimL family protein N-acetyltransferase
MKTPEITPNWQPNSLENSAIKLEKLLESDFESLFEVAAEPLIWEQHPTSDRYKKEVFKLFFNGAIEGKMAFKIIEKASAKIMGSSRFYDYKPENKSIAIGYTFLARKYWGGEFNKTIKKLMLTYAFEYVNNIFFHVGFSNIRSQKAIEKIGAKKVAEVDFDYYGRKLMHFEYLISKENWVL